jgi:rod shape-determining protein MreD
VRFLVVFIMAVVLLVLHATVEPRIAVWNVAPDLLVILVVQLAFRLPGVEAVAWPWGIGLAADLHGDGLVGLLAFTWGLIAFVINRLREFFFVESLVVRLAAVASAEVLTRAAIAISQLIGGHPVSFMLFLKDVFVGAIYTSAVAAALLPLLGAALRRVLPRKA